MMDSSDELVFDDDWDLLFSHLRNLTFRLNNSLQHHNSIYGDSQQHGPDAVQIVDTVFNSLVVAVGVSLNVALIITTLTSGLETTFMTKSFTLSLAISDLMHLTLSTIWDILTVNEYHWNLGRFGCRLYHLLPEICRLAWIGSLVMVSISLRRPKMMPDSGPRFAAPLSMAVVWLVSLVLITPFAVQIECHVMDVFSMVTGTSSQQEDQQCYCGFHETLAGFMMYSTALFYCLVLPVVVLSVLYCNYKPEINNFEPNTIIQHNHTPRLLVRMAMNFMGATIPRYIVAVSVIFLVEADSMTIINYHVLIRTIDFIARGLFNLSALIHPVLSPRLRYAIRNHRFLCNNQPNSSGGKLERLTTQPNADSPE